MAGTDHDLQFHLVADASQRGLGAVPFQLAGVSPGTEASSKLRDQERIIMFMSFKLADAANWRICILNLTCLAFQNLVRQ
jgi:hypothetical protein